MYSSGDRQDNRTIKIKNVELLMCTMLAFSPHFRTVTRLEAREA